MDGTDGWVEVDGLQLHYLRWGDPERRSMVLLHGTSSHAHLWDRFAPAFAEGFDVVAIDIRGHGQSEAPRDHLEGYRPEYWVSDLKEVVDALDLAPVVLIGHSGGALHGMHYAAAFPDDVARLVIIEMAAEVRREGADRVRSSIPRQEEFDSLDDGLTFLTGPGGRSDPELARAHAMNALEPVGDGRYKLRGDPALRRRDWMRPLRSSEENWAAARAVSCPTLLIRGAESKMITADLGDRMRDEMQDCTVVAIDGAGHNVPLHRPDELESVVADWLAGTG